MPSKSLPSASSLPERRHLNIIKKDDVSDIAENKSCYKNVDELCTRVAKLKLNEWDVTHKKENRFSLKKFVPLCLVGSEEPCCDLTWRVKPPRVLYDLPQISHVSDPTFVI